MELKSLFDEESGLKRSKIWEHLPPKTKVRGDIIPNLENEFYKLTKKRDYSKFKVRYLLIQDNTLYAFKSRDKPNLLGKLNLSVCRCEFLAL